MRQLLLYVFILVVGSVSAEQFKLTGKVVYADDKEPLIGATVQIKGTDRRTCTDIDGNFSIEVEKGEILKFSCVGYYCKYVEVLNDSSLIIELRDMGQMITPHYIVDSPDFLLPESELVKLQKQYESLSGEYYSLKGWGLDRVKCCLYKEIRHLCPMPLDQYAKQYIGVIHDGDLVFLVNLVSSKLMPQFKDRMRKSIITVDDGGNSFGRAIINYSTGEIIMLHWNGNSQEIPTQ